MVFLLELSPPAEPDQKVPYLCNFPPRPIFAAYSIPQITEIIGDIRDKAKVEEAMQGIDIVIHTAAALPLYSEEDIFSTDIPKTLVFLDISGFRGINDSFGYEAGDELLIEFSKKLYDLVNQRGYLGITVKNAI